MNSQQAQKEIANSDDSELDIQDGDDFELDAFADNDQSENSTQMSRYTARRKIEELKEEKLLREKMESYDDWD